MSSLEALLRARASCRWPFVGLATLTRARFPSARASSNIREKFSRYDSLAKIHTPRLLIKEAFQTSRTQLSKYAYYSESAAAESGAHIPPTWIRFQIVGWDEALRWYQEPSQTGFNEAAQCGVSADTICQRSIKTMGVGLPSSSGFTCVNLRRGRRYSMESGFPEATIMCMPPLNLCQNSEIVYVITLTMYHRSDHLKNDFFTSINEVGH